MHHDVIDEWGRRSSPLHRRDARVKVIACLALLAAIATCRPLVALAGYVALLAAGTLAAGLPPAGIALRAAIVLPFTGTFALITWLSGDTHRALALVSKSYVSALAVLLLAGTTRLPDLMRGLESLGVPRLLVLIVQFIYRYLFVISEQAQHMRLAAACRASAPLRSRLGLGSGKSRRSHFRAAAGMLGVLFARSYARADSIHRAMLARGFQGRFILLAPARVSPGDWAFLSALLALAAAIWAGGRLT